MGGKIRNLTSNNMLPIEVISAGAGSGKTYRLTGRMVELLQEGVRPAGIVATTFTQKAAAELQERVRVRLLETGMSEAANELGSALIGTVHSIGTRLLQRFAFEAGVSPLVEIIADGDSQRLFNESLAQVLTPKRIERMNHLADRLGLSKKKASGEPYDWRRSIREMTDVARANNFSKKVLETSKLRSWESFERLLPPVQNTDPVVWNNRLLSAIDQAVAALAANESDTTKVTQDAMATLRDFQNQLKYRGELYWHEWVKISKTNASKKSNDLLEEVHQLALRHDEHPQFRADIKEFMERVFDIATDALSEYEQYKKKRGLIDYTDMETYVSQLLRVQSVRDTLSREIDLLLVDEFQDTSPIQLDIFLQISRLAKRSIWVGDPKQSIYGFRGADPALMKAIIDATGGVQDANILKQSWRSRPDIVHAVNAIFTRAFPQIPTGQVVLEPARKDEAEFPPALQHWHFLSALDENKVPGKPWIQNCIADQIGVMLERKVLIYHKKTKEKRPIRPGDIAVLCRDNRDCQDMADALHRAGLKAAISRMGLLDTPEAKLALACLKYLLTPSDALSAAEILLLTNQMSLENLVENRLEWLRADPEQMRSPWATQDTMLEHLLQLRPRIADLSASEVLNLVLNELDLRRLVAPLGNLNQRLDNLDRLRRYALDYESACNRLHSAASLGGFLLWINDLSRNQQDAQGSGESEDAVKVLTYHRSKGLEYPVAICHNLDEPLKERIWGLNLVAETVEPDINNILGNRWLRFWVNPYADQFQKTHLEETLLQTEEWAAATRQALEEEARLLYVGLTRARDYLVFPTVRKPSRWLNRVFNQGDESIPTLDPNSDETPFYHNGMPLLIATECMIKPKDFPEAEPDTTPIPFHAPRLGRRPVPRAPLFIDAAGELPPGFNPQWDEPRPFAPWLEFKGDYSAALGKSVQTLLGVGLQQLSDEQFVKTARKQLQIRDVTEALSPEQMLQHAAAFRTFWQQLYAPTIKQIQYPLEGWHGKRLLQLQPDIFLENAETVVAIQFAGFAEGMKKWKNQAQAQAPLMGWTQVLLRQIFPQKKVALWVVFPMEGQAVELVL